MAIGERIRFLRNLRGMTQKQLGVSVGFPERTADVRMAQYESGTRTPKEKLVSDIATALGVSPDALTIPNIDTDIGLMHTFFALEDMHHIRIGRLDGELCLRLDGEKDSAYISMYEMFSAWLSEAEKLSNGEITKEEYDAWRYTYPIPKAERERAKRDALWAERKPDTIQ